ncbi:branched-chain amino acid ABC transporter permease [Microvirga pudoricolor]|uniref:branched-chain amino acid ABC transporter permease n=1 Tax=Microvirga pudoricolor TaxID=2778729 RepID=UPI00195059A9|nr:branched-chain amino acid ABC transporter permease [Microvirga pudoricolor]MBM6594417.1 branched-chain amino acid ABC transporter permease [Microvirga pudoricolor]
MNSAFRPVLIAVLALAGFFVPTLLGGSGAVYSACVLIAIFAVMSYGLDTVVSDLGEVSLAHTVFFAVGAYTTALLSTGPGFGPIATLLGALVVVSLIAAALGYITLGLREFAFSLVTYAVAVVGANLAQNWSFLGGSDGLRGIPAFNLSLGPLAFSAKNDQELWPIAYILLLIAIYVVYCFRRSRLGQAAMMSHLNPRLATMSGIDLQRTRLQVFLFSAPVTASAGWLYAYQRAYVSADVLETYFLILMLTAVVLVGRRVLLGPLIGVALIQVQEKFLSFGGYTDKIILGSVLVITLAFLPKGLLGLFQPLTGLFARRPSPVSETRL